MRAVTDHQAVRLAAQYLQFVLAIVFVALYVYATYAPPAPNSLRAQLDLWLCAVFAAEYVHRMLVRRQLEAACVRVCVGACLDSFGPASWLAARCSAACAARRCVPLCSRRSPCARLLTRSARGPPPPPPRRRRLQTAESKVRMLTSFWNACDLLSFLPPLLELGLRSTGVSFRWVERTGCEKGV